MNIKLDWKIYADAKGRIGRCSMCQQKRPNSVVVRASKHSITMQCKKCGLRWQVTSKSLYRAMEKEISTCSRQSNKYVETYLKMHRLAREVNVKGVQRFTPRGKRGSRERKAVIKALLKTRK